MGLLSGVKKFSENTAETANDFADDTASGAQNFANNVNPFGGSGGSGQSTGPGGNWQTDEEEKSPDSGSNNSNSSSSDSPGTFGEIIKREKQKSTDPNADSWSMNFPGVGTADVKRDPVGESSSGGSSSGGGSSDSDDPTNSYRDELRDQFQNQEEAIQSIRDEMGQFGAFLAFQQSQQKNQSPLGTIGGGGKTDNKEKNAGKGSLSMGVLVAAAGAILLALAYGGSDA